MILSVGATFAADDVALNDASDGMAGGSDALGIAVDTEAVGAGTSSVVTEDNFFDYFDEIGTLRDNVTDDELIFEGDFSNLGINYLSISDSIKLSGNNTALDGITFMIYADDVTVDGFTLTPYDVFGFYIPDEISNTQISNNKIVYNALEGCDSYAIYAGAISGLKILNNTITYVGNTDGTVINNAIRVQGKDDSENYYEDAFPADTVVVSGNTFDITMPSTRVNYDDWPDTIWYSDGIVFYYVDGLQFVNNTVTINYHGVAGSSDTIFGVAVRGNAFAAYFGAEEPIQSKNVQILDNTVTANGHGYIYAISACADDLTVSGNTITATADDNYANGINIEGPSNGVVRDNVIEVSAPISVYGIYTSQYNGALKMQYINNTITSDSYLSVGMELIDAESYAINNTITAMGNYTYGILASISDSIEIKGNDITLYGSNTGSDPLGDPIVSYNSMGISIKGPALIEDNTIYSTNIGLNFVEEAGTEVNHNTIAVEANNPDLASYAIYAKAISTKSPDSIIFTKNTIDYVANANEKVINNAVRIEGYDANVNKTRAIKNIIFQENTFDIDLVSLDVDYSNWPVTNYFSDGIVFYLVDGIQFINNTVDIEYTSYSGYSDTIYGIAVRGVVYKDDDWNTFYIPSKNIVINDNTITAAGHNYLYAVSVWGDELTISGNDITASADTEYANAINVESPSTNGIVSNNVLDVSAPNTVYGVYSFAYNGPIAGVTYENNTITTDGYLSVGYEVASENVTIVDSTITAMGNYTYGIVASVRGGEGTLSRNEIALYGSNVGTKTTGDSLTPKNSMGINVKGTSMIADNVIESTGLGINLAQDGIFTVDKNNIYVTAAGDVVNTAAINVQLSEESYEAVDATIINNHVEADTEYAVDMKNATGAVHDNYLVASDLRGDEAVSSTGDADVYGNTPVPLTPTDLALIYDEDAQEVVATLTNNVTGQAIKGYTVRIKLAGETHKLVTDANGQVRLSTADLTPGTIYTVTATFKETTKYYGSKSTVKVTVVADTALAIAYDEQTKEMVVTLTNNATGQAIKGYSVTVKLHGESYKLVTDANGQVRVSAADLNPGVIYTVSATFKATTKYNGAKVTEKVPIKANTTISISYSDNTKELVVTLENNNTGNAIKGFTLRVNLNGEVHKLVTDANGQVSLSTLGLPTGHYPVTVNFVETTKYYGSTATTEIECEEFEPVS